MGRAQVSSPVIALGIGLSSRCTAQELLDLVERLCATHGVSSENIGSLGTAAGRETLPAAAATAARLGLAIVPLASARLMPTAARCFSRSERSLTLAGVPSVAEAAALALLDPDGRLLGPRLASAHATAALAEGGQP